MPKKSDADIEIFKRQLSNYIKLVRRYRHVIEEQKKEIIRLNKKFILYFSDYDTDTEWDNSDADMSTT